MDVLSNVVIGQSSSIPMSTRAPSLESISQGEADNTSNSHSLVSTPPTSVADNESICSQPTKLVLEEVTVKNIADDGVTTTLSSSSRPRRARVSLHESLKVTAISGTAHKSHKKHGARGSARPITPKRRNISGDTLVAAVDEDALDSPNQQLVDEGIEALNLAWSPGKLKKSRSMLSVLDGPSNSNKAQVEPARRISTRSAGIEPMGLAHTLSSLGKRARNKFENISRGKRELMRLADTNEFAKIDTKPIVHTVWANGKFVPADQDGPPPRKRARTEDPKDNPIEEPKPVEVPAEEKKLAVKATKRWVNRGMFAGQDGEQYWSGKYMRAKDAKPTRFSGDKPNGALPLPIYAGDRFIERGCDFKLPFDICNPLPPGQPKPDEWRKMPKNRFVGDAQAAWKKSTLFDEFSSRCVCKPETGCDEWCQNYLMLYECDVGNCKFGAQEGLCNNRAFADLQNRKVKGGKFQVGVEVIKTADRGYGVRSNRCFKAGEIITEYTGEIITEQECDRRMNEDYVNNACYYLMSFEQNTILDATEKGSIARFVNHSCDPNCRMNKWVVAGKPRMALFAADRDIMTGEELTYDYNFDPFSAKNMQECRCGAVNCRGVLGPKPRDPKWTKPVANAVAAVKNAVVKTIGKGKRKLQEFLAIEPANEPAVEETEDDLPAIKKRKLAALKTKTKVSVSSLKRGLSISKKPAAQPTEVVVKRKYTRRVQVEKRNPHVSSRNSSLTIVAPTDDIEAEKADESAAASDTVQTEKEAEKQRKVVKKKSSSSLRRIKKDSYGAIKKPRPSAYVRKGGWGGNRRKNFVKGVGVVIPPEEANVPVVPAAPKRPVGRPKKIKPASIVDIPAAQPAPLENSETKSSIRVLSVEESEDAGGAVNIEANADVDADVDAMDTSADYEDVDDTINEMLVVRAEA